MAHIDRRAAYVVHTHRVIAEDLREILMGCGFQDVRIAARLDEVPTVGVAVAIVAARSKEIDEPPHLPVWVEQGVPTVILDGPPNLGASSPWIKHLSQPFQPADVTELIRKLGAI